MGEKYLSKLENLLRVLENGEWHDLSTIADTLSVSEEYLRDIARFLASIDILQYNKERAAVRIKQKWKTLLIDEGEPDLEGLDRTAIGTIIVPPEKTIVIQNTSITNLTDKSLELELKIDAKLREIAINTVK